MSINHTEQITGADGNRLWRVKLEVYRENGPSKVVVGVFKPTTTAGTGPNVLRALSHTWDDTRLPAQDLQDTELDELAQMASDAESDHLEGWLED